MNGELKSIKVQHETTDSANKIFEGLIKFLRVKS